MSLVNHDARGFSLRRCEGKPLSFAGSCRRGDGARDVGDQALIRGSTPHFRLFVRGCLCLGTGIGLATGHTTYPRVPLPLPRPRLCTHIC